MGPTGCCRLRVWCWLGCLVPVSHVVTENIWVSLHVGSLARGARRAVLGVVWQYRPCHVFLAHHLYFY